MFEDISYSTRNRQKTQKRAERQNKPVFQKNQQKMQTRITRIEQNNDRKQVMREIQFRSSFKPFEKFF